MGGLISFYISAGVAVLAALIAMLTSRSDRALAGFAVSFAALVVPLIQLRAATVAGVVLLAAAVIVILLGAVTRVGPRATGPGRRLPIAFWLPAGLALLGFVWVVLATGSRQVVDFGPALPNRAEFGDGTALLLELGANHGVPALLVALLALACVIAAVLGLVAGPARPAGVKAS